MKGGHAEGRGTGARETGRNAERVVVSNALDAPANPYGRLLADAVRDADASFRTTGFRPRALFALHPPGLWHLHWPENAATQRNGLRALTDVATITAAVTAARLRHVPIVWTAHNPRPHEPRRSWLAERFMGWLVPRVDGWISLSAAGAEAATARFPVLRQRPSIVVPHGHYADWYGTPPTRDEARAELGLGREDRVLLALGRIRPYKQVPELLAAFSRTPGRSLRLLIAGASDDDRREERIERLAGSDDRIVLRLGRVSDEEIPTLLAAVDGFVLPARRMFNSGSTLLALSYGVPVLVPDTPVMRELGAALPSGGVRLHDRGVTPAALKDFAASLPGIDRRRVAADVRRSHDWDRIGAATAEFFAALIDGAGARRGPR